MTSNNLPYSSDPLASPFDFSTKYMLDSSAAHHLPHSPCLSFIISHMQDGSGLLTVLLSLVLYSLFSILFIL